MIVRKSAWSRVNHQSCLSRQSSMWSQHRRRSPRNSLWSSVGSSSLAQDLYFGRWLLAFQQSNIIQDWRITPIVQDIISTIQPTFSWETRKVNKNTNFYIHHVTYWATIRSSSSLRDGFPFSPLEKTHMTLLYIHVNAHPLQLLNRLGTNRRLS